MALWLSWPYVPNQHIRPFVWHTQWQPRCQHPSYRTTRSHVASDTTSDRQPMAARRRDLPPQKRQTHQSRCSDSWQLMAKGGRACPAAPVYYPSAHWLNTPLSMWTGMHWNKQGREGAYFEAETGRLRFFLYTAEKNKSNKFLHKAYAPHV